MDGSKKVSDNGRQKQRKRKTNEISTESRTTSDIEEISRSKDMLRPKLIATKRVKPTIELDTPQMAEIKMKMQQKKAKFTQKSNSAGSCSQNLIFDISDDDDTSDGQDNRKAEIMTPQMKAISERIQKKNINKKVSKQSQSIHNVEEIEVIDITEDNVKIDRVGRKRKGGVTTSSSTNQDLPNSSNSTQSNFTGSGIRGSLVKNTGLTKSYRSSFTKNKDEEDRYKYHFDPEETKIENKGYGLSKKCGKLTFKKNIAKDRMEKLRKVMKQQIRNQQDNNSSLSNDEELLAIVDHDDDDDDDEFPDIYKASDVRYKNLRNRLLNNNAISNEDEMVAAVVTNMRNNRSLDMSSENQIEFNDSSTCEEMDWEPMEDEKITFEVQAARTQLCVNSNMREEIPMEWNFLSIPTMPVQEEKIILYMVVDTNVFLSNLEAIVQVMFTEFARYDKPVIVVPWNVIRELDYLKDDKFGRKSARLRESARKAINFLNDHFSIKHPRLVGQTLEDARRNRLQYAVECPDDEILQTCLQIRNSGRVVALLSYDKNLCNKAMIYEIIALGRNDPLDKIDYICGTSTDSFLSDICFETTSGASLQRLSLFDDEIRRTNDLFEDIQEMMKDILTVIVSKEMTNLFGEAWKDHTIVRPPWTILCALKCALKHWIAATSEAFDRQAEQILKELMSIFTVKSQRRFKDIKCILEKCRDLTQMINVERYSELMSRALTKVENLQKRCQNDENELRQRWILEEIGVENDATERKRRADKAFEYFDNIYTYARAIGGMAADIVNMTCNFRYDVPNPAPSVEYVKRIQPEIGHGVNRLLRILSKALDGMKDSTIDYKTLYDLYHLLTNFLPESTMMLTSDLCPLDVHCCLKEKEDTLRMGVKQLQELGAHYSRLASYHCI